jgi:cytochrome c biogenesis protein CcdA
MIVQEILIPGFGFLDVSQLGVLVFLLGGFATAISPCLFPILPLSLLRMFRAESRKKALLLTTVLMSGVVLAFMVIAIAFLVFQSFFTLLLQNFDVLNLIFGLILIILGIVLIVPQLRELTARIPGLQPDIGGDSVKYLDVFTLGLSYSLIAAPCAAPVFLVLLGLITAQSNILFTFFGFPFFVVGLVTPYYILALASSEFRMQIARWMAARSNLVNIIMGVLVILIGLGMVMPSIPEIPIIKEIPSLPIIGPIFEPLFTGQPWWNLIGENLLAWLLMGLILILVIVAIISYVKRRSTTEIIE